MLLVLLLALGLAAQPSSGSRCVDGAVERTLSVFADYHQFVVADSRSRLRGLPGAWTDAAVDRGYVAGEDHVAVATARNLRVPVTIRVLPEAPGAAAAGWDRAAETVLEVASGELVVGSVTAARGEGERIRVAPGGYRVRLLAGGLETVSRDGRSGTDRYVVELWPEGS